MTDSPLALLDAGAGPDVPGSWGRDMAGSLGRDRASWLRVVGTQPQVGLSREQGWILLAWVEDAASELAGDGSRRLLETACFAISLLEASPLDRRDVIVVAMLLRRAAGLAGLDFAAAVRDGCAAAGDLGTRCAEWLAGVSDALPATHEQVGTGRETRFRRRPSTIDTDELLRKFGRPDS